MNIKVNANDIMMALGYKDTSANEFVLEQAEVAAQKANELSNPRKIFKKVKINKIEKQSVKLETGEVFSCESLAQEVKGCTHLIIAIVTIGHKMDEAIRAAFKAEDPLLAMMLDAAGSKAVSYFANHMWKKFIESLGDGYGITKGFTPGSLDFPIDQQAEVFKILDASKIDVSLNDSKLMTPAKSISVVYGTGKDIQNSCVAHSCSGCPKEDCMMRDDREVEIKIHINDEEKIIKSPIGANLKEVFKKHDIPQEFPCNGRGTCGGCSAKFVKTVPKKTRDDIDLLSTKKLEDGWRLTCEVMVEHPLELYIENAQMQILSEEKSGDTEVARYAVAVDIGTTTIVCHLIDADDGNIIDTVGDVNGQRKYGADVASRILHEMTDKDGKKHLNSAIISQLNKMIKKLVERNSVSKIDMIWVAGNTIMTHILLGYDIVGLGQAPYTPVSLDRAHVRCKSLGLDFDCEITVMEGMDSYVGADISVGAAICSLMESGEYSLLIDLGTNGEIALGNSEILLCCATAAGPAFEAVNIHNGMSGLPGAVSEFSYEDGEYKYKTIGDKKPLGICGSGVLDITATLIQREIVDLTGRLLKDKENVKFDENVKEYFVVAHGRDDEIIFTAKDVREIQLAKAAISAGIKTLIETAGIDYDKISKVYIAGGFGNYMDIKSALDIGLIPKELSGKTEAAGNTSAKGAVACHNQEFLDKVADYVEKSRHVELSTSMIFQNHYIESMGFDG